MKPFFLLLIIPFTSIADVHPGYITFDNVKNTVVTFKQDDWKAIFSNTAAGEKEWLGPVPILATATNQKQSVDLEGAMSTALSANTTEALKILTILDMQKYPFMIGSDIICGVPTEKTESEITEFYQRTRGALLNTDAGAKCLWILEATYDEWQQSRSK